MKEGKVTSYLAKVEVLVYSVVVEVVVVVIQYTRNLPLLSPFSLSLSSFLTLPSPLSLCTVLCTPPPPALTSVLVVPCSPILYGHQSPWSQ